MTMRAWLVFTLIAFTGTVFSPQARCSDHHETPVSMSKMIDVTVISDSSKQTSSNIPASNHSVDSCNHIHCCGVILSYSRISFTYPFVVRGHLLSILHFDNVNLELPIKPPAV